MNKAYYGEYTLKHWIELMLCGEITLPTYQRTFVWGEEQVNEFAVSLEEELFIPPVTIGHYSVNGMNEDIIIDGQQRLTSLLLLWLNVFPEKDIYHVKKRNSTIDINDDIIEDDEALEWTFNEIVQSINGETKKEEIRKIIENKRNSYRLDFSNNVFGEDFYEKHYIGYAYLVPDKKQAQCYYAKTFKCINSSGIKLNPQEARKSLYYMVNDIDKFFNPNIEIMVNKGGKEPVRYQVDFVRYLSFAFQYGKMGKGNVAKRFARRYEEYYQIYILSVIDDKNGKKHDDRFVKYESKYNSRVNNVAKTIENVKPVIECSVIDQDMYLCGLVYWIVIKGKTLDSSRYNDLVPHIDREIKKIKQDALHTKNPAALKYLNHRVDTSIEIYKDYVNG